MLVKRLKKVFKYHSPMTVPCQGQRCGCMDSLIKAAAWDWNLERCSKKDVRTKEKDDVSDLTEKIPASRLRLPVPMHKHPCGRVTNHV